MLGLQRLALRVGAAALGRQVLAQRARQVEARAGAVEQRAGRLHVGRHQRQHRLDQRLLDDRGAELDALRGVLARLAKGGLRHPDRLRRDAEAGVVHQVQHGAESLSGLAEQEALRVVELDHAGGRAVDAELGLHPGDPDAVAPPVGQDLRAEDQAEPVGGPTRLVVGRGVARQDEVHVGAAVGDEDLLAVDDVVVAVARGARGDAAQVRPRLRFGQIHAPLVLAAGEPGQIALLDLVAAVRLDVVRHARLQPHDGHEARVGARDHLEVGAVDQDRQAVAAVRGAERQRDEAGGAQLLVAGGDVRRHHHLAVLEDDVLVPVVARPCLDRLADLAGGAQDHLVGLDLIAPVRVRTARQAEVPRPVDPMVEEELHVAVEELLRHGEHLLCWPAESQRLSTLPRYG